MLDKESREYYNECIVYELREVIKDIRSDYDEIVALTTEELYSTVPMEKYHQEIKVFDQAAPKIIKIDNCIYIAEILEELYARIDHYIDEIYHDLYPNDSEEL